MKNIGSSNIKLEKIYMCQVSYLISKYFRIENYEIFYVLKINLRLTQKR